MAAEVLDITVKTISAIDYTLSYPAASSIQELKLCLLEKHPLLKDQKPPLEFRLISSGRLLNDTASLTMIPKVPGSNSSIIIHLVTKPVPPITPPSTITAVNECTPARNSTSSYQVPSQPIVQPSSNASILHIPPSWPFALPYQVVYINGMPYAMVPAYSIAPQNSSNVSSLGVIPSLYNRFSASPVQSLPIQQQPQSPQPNHQPPQPQPAQPNNRAFVDDEFGERQNAPQAWWWLLLKLGFLLYIFGQQANIYRMAAMCITALFIFLSQMGWVRLPRIEVIQRNQEEVRPLVIGGGGVAAAPVVNNNLNAHEDVAPQPAEGIPALVAHQPPVPIVNHNLGMIDLAGQVIVRFLTSLFPDAA